MMACGGITLTSSLNAPGNFAREPFWISRMVLLLSRFFAVFRVRQHDSDIHELVVVLSCASYAGAPPRLRAALTNGTIRQCSFLVVRQL